MQDMGRKMAVEDELAAKDRSLKHARVGPRLNARSTAVGSHRSPQ